MVKFTQISKICNVDERLFGEVGKDQQSIDMYISLSGVDPSCDSLGSVGSVQECQEFSHEH
jgi:hypothetical protein